MSNPEEAPFPKPSWPQRLSIGHLLMLMAGCGVSLAIMRYHHEQFGIELSATDAIMRIAFCLLDGLALAAVGIIGIGWLKGQRDLPMQPGHWLLCHFAAAILIELLVMLYVRGLGFAQSQDQAKDAWTLFAVNALVRHLTHTCLAIIVLATSYRYLGRWRWYVYLYLVFSALNTFADLDFWHAAAITHDFENADRVRTSLELIFRFARLAVVIATDWIDRRSGYSRDRLHNLGIWVIALSTCMRLAWMIQYFWRTPS